MTKTNHIIALSCSPSRGRNSDSMLDAFIEGMQHVSEITTEKIYLDDIQIDHYSYANGKTPSAHEQAFAELAKRITQSPGLVIATPTYNFSVPGHLKNFIDRIRFIALDMSKKNRLGQPVGKLENLRAYFLVSGGTPVWAEKILFFAFPLFWLRSVFLYYGAQCIGGYYSGDVRSFENKKILEKCRKQGERYAMKIKKKRKHGILERIFWRPPQTD